MTGGSHQALLQFSWAVLIVFTVLAFAAVVVLLALRAGRDLRAGQRESAAAAARTRVTAAMAAEDNDAETAWAELTALRGRAWADAEAALLRTVPKVRGDARIRALELLRAKGTERRALRQIRSGRSMQRARGAFALGAVESRTGSSALAALLDDRSPLVRRIAVRALGSAGDPTVAPRLLDAADRDEGLSRDVAFALSRLGPEANPALRAAVASATASDTGGHAGRIAAEILGSTGDVTAVPVLSDAVDQGPEPVQLAAAHALGILDAPAGLWALRRALRSRSPQLQVAAATSLGALGDPSAVDELVEALRHPEVAVARAAGTALLRIGPIGRSALHADNSPCAIETLALDALRSRP